MLNIPEEIKDLFKKGNIRKNFRVSFIDTSLPDLTNSDIVQESVSFTESLCSKDELKFGLCEASAIKFKTINVSNIKGKEIRCGIDVDCSSLVAENFESVLIEPGISDEIKDSKTFNNIETGETIYVKYRASNTYSRKIDIKGIIGEKEELLYSVSSTSTEYEYVVPYDMDAIVVEYNIKPYTDSFIVDSYLYISRGNTIDGICVKSDLNYPSYYIPYGEFIVESCKKDGDTLIRSITAYSKENVVGYDLPPSINALFWYTRAIPTTIKLSAENILDLTFPSYSASRHRLYFGESQLNRRDTINGVTMATYYMYAKIGTANTDNDFEKTIFTYKALFDKDKHKELLDNAMDSFIRLSNKTPSDSQIGSIKNILSRFNVEYANINNAYTEYTVSGKTGTYTGGNWYSTTIDWINPSDNTIYLDNSPHTILKLTESVEVTKSTHYYYSGMQLDPINNLGIQGDTDGYIKIPYKIELYNSTDYEEYKSGNYIMMHKYTLDDSDISVVSLSTDQQLRNVFSVSFTIGTSDWGSVKSAGYRLDQAFNKSITKLKGNWRKLVEASIEIVGKLGHFNRYGNFELKSLQLKNDLFPSETFYPSEIYYPQLASGFDITRAIYTNVWLADAPTNPISMVSASYTDESGVSHSINERLTTEQIESTVEFDLQGKSKKSGTDFKLADGKTHYIGIAISIESTVPITSVEFKFNLSEGDKTIKVETPSTRRLVIDRSTDDGFDICAYMSNAEQVSIAFTEDNKPVSVKILNVSYIDRVLPTDYSIYDLSDNYILSEMSDETTITNIVKEVGENIKNIQYTPSEIECMGQPYLEPGDWITVVTSKTGFDSVILNRTLSGIQSLKDSYESGGE